MKQMFGAALGLLALLGCNASTISDGMGDGGNDRSAASLASPAVARNAGAEPAWQLPSGAEVALLATSTDDGTRAITARLRIGGDDHVLRIMAGAAGYDLRLESGSGDFFGIEHGLSSAGVDVITEYTPTERMSISREVLTDGRVREVYAHSTAGRRVWVHPSESSLSDAFLSEYPVWFPEVSSLTGDNRLGVWLGEIAHGDVFGAITAAVEDAAPKNSGPGDRTLIDAVTSAQPSTAAGPGTARLPGWFDSFCSALGGAARGKCAFGGPANAGCYYFVGAAVGCVVVEVFDAAGWL